MDNRNVIIAILGFLITGCSAPFLDVKSEPRDRNHICRASASELGGGPRNLDNRISSDIAGVERS